MYVAAFFQAHQHARKIMNRLFKELDYDLANKRFVLGHVLGYCPNLKDLTLDEMEQVITYLRNELKTTK